MEDVDSKKRKRRELEILALGMLLGSKLLLDGAEPDGFPMDMERVVSGLQQGSLDELEQWLADRGCLIDRNGVAVGVLKDVARYTRTRRLKAGMLKAFYDDRPDWLEKYGGAPPERDA